MKERIFLFALGIIFFPGCLTYQIGNPSLTGFSNQGVLGIYSNPNPRKEQLTYIESCTFGFAGLISTGGASTDILLREFGSKELFSIDHVTKRQYLLFQETCVRFSGR